MRDFLSGIKTQLRVLFWSRFLILLLMLFAVSVTSMGIYANYVVKDMPVAILDFDQSKISRTIAEYLSATREVRLVDVSGINSTDEAIARVDRGEIAAVLVLPENLSEKIKSGKLALVPLYLDMSNILIGKNLYKPIAKVVTTVAYGAQLQMVKKLGERKDKAMARVAPVSADETFAFNPATNYVIYIVPGLLFYFFGIYVMIVSASVFLGNPVLKGFGDILGRLSLSWVWFMLLGSFYIWGVMPIMDIITETPPTLILTILALFTLACIIFASAVYALYRKQLLALQSTIICAMLSLMFAGITWPTDTFPPLIQWLATWLPFTYFAKAYQSFLHYPVTFEDMAAFIDGLKTQILVFTIILLVGVGFHAVRRRLITRKGAAA